LSESSAYHPFDQETPFERPPSTKAAARAARRADRVAKQTGQQPKPLQPKNPAQADYIDVLRAGESAFSVGPAGTGKTYIAARIAAQRLIKGDIEKIIISRVTVSSPRHAIGFLPGNIEAKMKPWLTPVIEGIRAEVSGQTLDKWKAEGKFEIVPFEYMRGRTFDNAAVILDEAQNACFADLELFVTRTGVNSQVVICGDPGQIDIPNSGLGDLLDLAEEFEIMDVVEFTEDDVVRSPLAKVGEGDRRLQAPECRSLQ
jgi:phosphate starvation-inducible PhoH-like protein